MISLLLNLCRWMIDTNNRNNAEITQNVASDLHRACPLLPANSTEHTDKLTAVDHSFRTVFRSNRDALSSLLGRLIAPRRRLRAHF